MGNCYNILAKHKQNAGNDQARLKEAYCLVGVSGQLGPEPSDVIFYFTQHINIKLTSIVCSGI